MARTAEIISLDAHAVSIKERMDRFMRNVECSEFYEASNNLTQAKATLEALQVKLFEVSRKRLLEHIRMERDNDKS